MSSSSSELLQEYYLDVRHDDGILPDNKSPPPPPCPNAFFIQINLHINFHVLYPTNFPGLYYVYPIPIDRQTPRDTVYLSSDDGAAAERFIYSLLDDELRAPEDQQQPMADKFSSFVIGMARDPYFANRSLLPVVLDIYVNYEERYYDGIFSEIQGFMALHRGERKRAKTSTIQTLERVEYSSLVSMDDCSICLDEFLAGRQLARLPCSHLYHHGCIIKWLLKNRLCPLCRFCID